MRGLHLKRDHLASWKGPIWARVRGFHTPLLVVTVLCIGISASLADTYPRRIGIDVLNYRFEVLLSDASDEIFGRSAVTVLFTRDGVAELPLDLTDIDDTGQGMRVLGVSSGGTKLDFVHREDVLRIAISPPSRAGARLGVIVEYSGFPAGGLRIGPNRHGQRMFFSDNWPTGARHWLPTIDHPGDKATNEFIVTAPAHYQVVSNGRLLEETDQPGDVRLTHWKNSVPISSWLYALGVAGFAVQQLDTFQGKPIQTWAAAQDRDAGFYDFAVPVRQAMEFYSDYVGLFAYEKLANVTSPATSGGMESATAIMYSENSVTGQRSVRWRNVIIHEVAHHWFGNAVTEADWDHVWLSEGFATYFTLLFIEHAYGREEFVTGLKGAAAQVWEFYRDHPNYRIVHDNLDDMQQVTSVSTYQKGAWVLHMLRGRLGDEAFRRGIRAYYAGHLNGNAITADFRRAMEEASGVDLKVFFQRWLYEGGNPRLKGTWCYRPSSHEISIDLTQAHQVGVPFDLPLEIGIFYPGEAFPQVSKIYLSTERGQFTVPVEREPGNVVLDPRTWTLLQSDFQPCQRGQGVAE